MAYIQHQRAQAILIDRRNAKSAWTPTMVNVRLRSEIPGVTLEDKTYSFSREVPWDSQLALHNVNVNAAEHCIRRAGGGANDKYGLNEPVKTFQHSFASNNRTKFVAVLCLKNKGPRRNSVRTRIITPPPSPPVPIPEQVTGRSRAVTAINQHQRKSTQKDPKSLPRKSPRNAAIRVPNNPTILSSEQLSEEATIFPRILANLSKIVTRQSSSDKMAPPGPPPPGIPVRKEDGNTDTRPVPGPFVVVQETTQDGDLASVEQKNICLKYIEKHWNNKDTTQILWDVRELKRNNNYRAFTRLMPFTAGFLEEFAMVGGPFVVEQFGQRFNIRDEDTQQGNAEDVTEKTRWLRHVQDHLSNADILKIRDELQQLIKHDKYRAFLRLLPFTAGFIKETFFDILQ